jgi:predicted transcriptional regulator
MAERSSAGGILELTAKIVAAQVANNATSAAAVPSLIQSIYATLADVDRPPEKPVERSPAVPIKKSVFADYLICLEDGRKLKMLKRHLKTAYNLSPEQYRERWGLGPDYPMVAPNYAKHRSVLAHRIGLGTRARGAPIRGRKRAEMASD